jgi:wobble nucleotide-excising tRNase
MITRINKIEGHRVFSNFSWPADLPEFGRFNLIYGWNGSGKTTLSNLLRCLERRQSIVEGKVDFLLDGKVCSGATLSSATGIPQIRVFNQDYRDDSVFAVVQQLKPIFFLGKDSVDKQRQIVDLNAAKLKEQKKAEEKNTAKTKATKALEEFCIREAKAIKELLSSSGPNFYNNYDKAYFKGTCASVEKLNPLPGRLTEEEKTKLKQQKEETAKGSISKIAIEVLDLNLTRQETENLLKRTVLSQVIAELSGDPTLAEWVLEGIGHHTGDKHTDKCKFCTSALPKGRMEELQAHFNDEYSKFLSELDTASSAIAKSETELKGLQLPPKAEFYDHLATDYSNAVEGLDEFVKQAIAYLGWLSEALAQKRTKPFESVALEPFINGLPMPDENASLAAAVNGIIDRHNAETANFEKVVGDARKRLETDLVLEALPDFREKNETIKSVEGDLKAIGDSIKELGSKIAELEKDILEHRRPADELSAELRSYLGRDELKFEVAGNGYRITRSGIPAKNLSEGERTAIALLYFLKSLQDKAFDVTSDVVVIDDPVSSLDANSLFCAFGYLRERTREAGQLIILTHNFPLFRQVKNWFHHLPKAHRPARFYMVESGSTGGKRNAWLKPLDPLLHEYESEYHYLFKRVHEEANKDPANRGLEEFYPMPNVARRVLESFLSFRYPAHAGKLEKQVGFVLFDAAKKARILRFLHTYSHDQKIAEAEHDLSILAETPNVLKDLLDMLKAEDQKHYDEMVKLISAVPDAA